METPRAMEETPTEETWRSNEAIVNALDRLILKAAPELDIIMSEIDSNQSIKEKASGNMGVAFGFAISLFCVFYERGRRANANKLEAWDAAVAAAGAHPMTQSLMARSAASVIDRQAEGLTE